MDNKMCFETNSLGKLKILAFINEYALLEKQYDTPEKYIIAVNFDMENKRWDFGKYYVSFEDAYKTFSDRVYNTVHSRTPEEKIKMKFHNSLYLIEARFEPDEHEKEFEDLLKDTLRLTEEEIKEYKEYSSEQISNDNNDMEMEA